MTVGMIVTSITILFTACTNESATMNTSEMKPRKLTAQKWKKKVWIVTHDLSMKYPDEFDENDNPYLNYIEDHTELDIEIIHPSPISYEKTINRYFLSGRVPDMMSIHSSAFLSRYVHENKLMPLNELLDRYGPHLKAAIPQQVWDKVSKNGLIYAIPSLNETRGHDVLFVRKDWLHTLGLQPPQTLAQMEQVIRAFSTQDPDRNGLRDTYGFAMMPYLRYTSPILGAFGIQLDHWVIRNDKLVFANIQPEMKEAVAFLAQLYQEGMISPSSLLYDFKTSYNELIIKPGKVGMFVGDWFETRAAIAQHKEVEPDAEWIAIDAPIGKNGQRGTYELPEIWGYQVIPKDSKKAAEVIRMLDFIVGEGKHVLEYGFKDEIWNEESGNLVTNFKAHDKHAYRGIYSKLVKTNDRRVLKERLHSLGEQYQLYENVLQAEKHVMRNAFEGWPTRSMYMNNPQLDELKVMFNDMIMGIQPLDYFDEYVKRWNGLGGKSMTTEVNDWFETVQSEGGR
ncbi:extracellular solute-binding protein [Paenibacillus sp. 481]|uniref:extracellular solute-binding protein n=1 Tax=Paenibacillus sp. 481 TaxID=2835869 RepID=UPI001E62DA69|nr:extracellular solute-binding protein [Paenibacillus sp. 481]UHA74947.1 extracellular solute-binding protein [Paenibacillus sp. 481]